MVAQNEKGSSTTCSKMSSLSKAKIEHKKPTGMLQSLDIPEWKWDSIVMNFVVDLQRTIQKI